MTGLSHARRIWWILYTAGFLLWQVPWPAVAAMHQTASAHAQCVCRGTSLCCCLQHRAQERAAPACHLRQPTSPLQASDCRLLPAGCHHAPMTTESGLSHEDLLSPEASVLADASAASVEPVIADRAPPTVFLDPPFVPPKPLRS